ncbi:MAG TPA: thermonuclease family protein [Pyrinomonadaceae bacterium]|nr:thermonuclease family protein [Pyrinomonadaceae bacterium]
MKIFMCIGLYCLLLSYSQIVVAQNAEPADPCGDAAVESQSWGIVRGRVIKVEKGDTVVVSLKGRKITRVNLVGIDAPEHGKPFSKASRLLLESLLKGKVIEVWVNNSKWLGRQVPVEIAGVVRLRNIELLDVNLLMLQSGMAQHKQPEPYTMSSHSKCHYARAEDEARAARRGLWRGAA